MSAQTTKLHLHYPTPSDTPDVPSDMETTTSNIDDIVPAFIAGVAASRPVPGTYAAPGGYNRFYYATDTGTVSYDNGSAWVELGPIDTVDGDILPPAASPSAGSSPLTAAADHQHPYLHNGGEITGSGSTHAIASGGAIVPLDTQIWTAGNVTFNSGSHAIEVAETGYYVITWAVAASSGIATANCNSWNAYVLVNGTISHYGSAYASAVGQFPHSVGTAITPLPANGLVTLGLFQDSGHNQSVGGTGSNAFTYLSVMEFT